MDNLTKIKEAWPAILERLKSETNITTVSFETWLKPLVVLYADNEGVTLYVSSGKMGINIMNKRYNTFIREALYEETGLNLRIHYTVDKTPIDLSSSKYGSSSSENLADHKYLNEKYTFDSFVVGSNNSFAHSASLAVAESPGEIYNPLYLYAGVGLGKTHLMHSIAHYILNDNPDARVVYVTAEIFTNEVIESIRTGNMTKFREKYRNSDILLLDDIQFIIGKESTQAEFFHTFEDLCARKKQIIISSDKPPKDLNILEERISSRLEMGLIADISSPDYETRMAILRKKTEEDGLKIDDKILDYIASNIHSNIRELEGCLNRVRAKAILEKRTITLELAKDILRDLITTDKNNTVTSEMIVKTVAEHFGLTVQEISSSKRDKKFAYPRSIAMYLCRNMTEDSLLTIAYLLNRKDHTTVMNSVKKIEKEMMMSNSPAKTAIDTIRKKLGS